jgi:hypothetical protein
MPQVRVDPATERRRCGRSDRRLRFLRDTSAVSLPFLWLIVYETKDKTLEQMQDTTELNSFLTVRHHT